MVLLVNLFLFLVPTSGSGDTREHTWCTVPAAAVPECPRTAHHAQQPHPSDSHWHEHHTHTAQHPQPTQSATPGTSHLISNLLSDSVSLLQYKPLYCT